MKGTLLWFRDGYGKLRQFKVKFHFAHEFPAVMKSENLELRDVTYAIVQELTDGMNKINVGYSVRKPGDTLNYAHGQNMALVNCLGSEPLLFDEYEIMNFLVAFGAARAETNIVKQLECEANCVVETPDLNPPSVAE